MHLDTPALRDALEQVAQISAPERFDELTRLASPGTSALSLEAAASVTLAVWAGVGFDFVSSKVEGEATFGVQCPHIVLRRTSVAAATFERIGWVAYALTLTHVEQTPDTPPSSAEVASTAYAGVLH